MNRIIDTGAGLMMEIEVGGKLTLRPASIAVRKSTGIGKSYTIPSTSICTPEVREHEALVESVGGSMVIVNTR